MTSSTATIFMPASVPTAARKASADAILVMGTRCLLVGLIVGIFALKFSPLLLASLAVCLLVFACLACVRPIHRVGIVVILNYVFWLLSGAISGGLQRSALTSGEFWRGEGRCFLFYLPLLALSVMRLREAELRFIVKLTCILTVAGAVLCALWLLGFGHLFQAEEDAETGQLNTSTFFIGLLTSHTGAGAFWATVTAFLAAYSLQMHDKRIQLLAIIAAMLTLGTGGRAATLGLIAVVCWLVVKGELLNRRTFRVAIPVIVLAVVGSSIVAVSVPEVSGRMAEMFEPRTYSSVSAALREPTLKDASGYFHSGGDLENHNLEIRVFLWKYALHLFAKSPAIGIGFGRFNDTNLESTEIPHVLSLASGGEPFSGAGIRWERGQEMTSTGNAHNSYLHMLAETGLLGLALFFYLWFQIYQYCNQRCISVDPRFGVAYGRGCQAAVICLMAASLAGHALAAPSGGILLTTMIGGWISANWQDGRLSLRERTPRGEVVKES